MACCANPTHQHSNSPEHSGVGDKDAETPPMQVRDSNFTWFTFGKSILNSIFFKNFETLKPKIGNRQWEPKDNPLRGLLETDQFFGRC
ncbi:hypothetical protein HUJ05_001550 [Dendroctonus ponderosae]|nr:hypothetical protein HUJ05_001550 [Dendroctonus ponderosae]